MRLRKHFLATCLSGLAILFFLNCDALRADVTGTILGNVTDPSGAAVPGAEVTLSNAATGLNRKASTDPVGFYQFLAVPVGENYTVEVELKGFQKSTQPGIKLLVNQKYKADFQLVVGRGYSNC
jgi:hypothetical protein